jgi:hypothetical protein
MNSVVEKKFSKAEFSLLFQKAARQCYRAAIEKYCAEVLPEALKFYLPDIDCRYDFDRENESYNLPAATIKDFTECIPFLLNQEGLHRPDIRLSPFGVFNETTVIEIDWDGDWTDKLIQGDLAFSTEPFIVMGPALPAGWNPGQPLSVIQLPQVRLLSEDFDWSLPLNIRAGLTTGDPIKRKACLDEAIFKVVHGFTLHGCLDNVLAAARIEEQVELKRAFSELLFYAKSENCRGLWMKWAEDNDLQVRALAYGALSSCLSEDVVTFLLSLIEQEKTERGQQQLLKALAQLLEEFPDYHHVFNERLAKITLFEKAQKIVNKINLRFL